MKFLFLQQLFFFVFLSLNVLCQEDIVRIVDAVYQGSFEESPKVAVEKAKTEALKKASEEIVGLYISSFTEIENFQLIKDKIKTFSSSIIKVEVLNDPYDYYMKNSGKVFIKIKATVSKNEIEKFIKSMDEIKSTQVETLLNERQTKTFTENIYGSLVLETTFAGKLYVDGNWHSEVTAGQKITIDYLKEGEHTLFIKLPDDKTWEKVFYITKGVQSEITANLSEYKSAVDLNTGLGFDLGPIYSLVNKSYPIENRGRFLVWKDIGSRKDIAYITDQGRIIICSKSPLRTLSDVDVFWSDFTVVLIDYIGKVQAGINDDLRNSVWDWKRIMYAQDRNIYKCLIAFHTKIPGELNWIMKIPDIEVSQGRMSVFSKDRHWEGGKPQYFINGNLVLNALELQVGIQDITKFLLFGTHSFSIKRGTFGFAFHYLKIETINTSNPEKLVLSDNKGMRIVDHINCWNIEELELPK